MGDDATFILIKHIYYLKKTNSKLNVTGQKNPELQIYRKNVNKHIVLNVEVPTSLLKFENVVLFFSTDSKSQ